MVTKRKHKVIRILHRSCLTDQPVWLSPQRSRQAEAKAYKRACKHEIERIKGWGKRIEQRKGNILHLLSDLMANIPIFASVAEEQAEAAKQLNAIAEKSPLCYRDFYNHIMERKRKTNN